MNPFKSITCLAVMVLAFAIAGCGGDDDVEPVEPATPDTEAPANGNGDAAENGDAAANGNGDATTIEIVADPDGAMAYTETEITVPAGDVIVEFENPSVVPHDVAFDDPSGELIDKTAVFTEDSETLRLNDLEPGEYRYWCTVPGHLEAGMEGTLVVE